MTTMRRVLAYALAAAAGAMLLLQAATADDVPVYPTWGVHNPPSASTCTYKTCVYTRGAGQPTDPSFPAFWTSDWKMYRVFEGYIGHPPPYYIKPPLPGADYETSSGTTYYDSTWRSPRWPGQGAMMESYTDRCLPIFPIPNHFSCAFISLGDTAFFLSFGTHPDYVPALCLFSKMNHPPETDFVKHLPYDATNSQGRGIGLQAYGFWVSQAGQPVQLTISPDMTSKGGILFGYAFYSEATPDRVDHGAAPYRHPESFFFSGAGGPGDPPDAPIVSQNYTNFAMVRPNPKDTWDRVMNIDPSKLPVCNLFAKPPAPNLAAHGGKGRITWGDIGRHK
jgi:hypothetical protein